MRIVLGLGFGVFFSRHVSPRSTGSVVPRSSGGTEGGSVTVSGRTGVPWGCGERAAPGYVPGRSRHSPERGSRPAPPPPRRCPEDGGGAAVVVPLLDAALPALRDTAGAPRFGRGAGDALRLPDRDGGGEEGEK